MRVCSLRSGIRCLGWSADDLQVVEGGSGGPLVARPSETVVLHSCTSERNWRNPPVGCVSIGVVGDVVSVPGKCAAVELDSRDGGLDASPVEAMVERGSHVGVELGSGDKGLDVVLVEAVVERGSHAREVFGSRDGRQDASPVGVVVERVSHGRVNLRWRPHVGMDLRHF